MKNTLTKSLGEIILGIGKLSNKEHLINLGHYMSCKGGKRILNDKFNSHLLKLGELANKEYKKSIYGSSNVRYLSTNEVTFYGENYSTGNNKLTRELHKSVGKSMVKKVKNVIFLLDRYEFYPWCGNYDHVSNCGCLDKDWAYVTVFAKHEYFPNKITQIFKNILSINLFQHGLSIRFLSKTIFDIEFEKKNLIKFNLIVSTFGISFDMDISDEIFNNLGKPFYTVKRIQLEE